MNKLLCLILTLSAILLSVSGCTGGDNGIKASLNQEFTLAVGQTAVITGEGLEIKFLDITEDSRCPKDVTCIWAGQVSCSLNITLDSISEQVILTQPGLSNTDSGQTINGYSYVFTVEPYPESGKEINKEDYRLKMTVSKP